MVFDFEANFGVFGHFCVVLITAKASSCSKPSIWWRVLSSCDNRGPFLAPFCLLFISMICFLYLNIVKRLAMLMIPNSIWNLKPVSYVMQSLQWTLIFVKFVGGAIRTRYSWIQTRLNFLWSVCQNCYNSYLTLQLHFVVNQYYQHL